MIQTLKTNNYVEPSEEQKETWDLLKEVQISWAVMTLFERDLHNYAELRKEFLYD